MVQRIVINDVHGGFGLSEAGMRRYAEIKDISLYPEKDRRFGILTIYWTVPPDQRPKEMEGIAWAQASQEEKVAYNVAWSGATLSCRDLARDDPVLVQVVSDMGDEANGKHASLTIVDIPDGVEWQIEEYDGAEWVAEKHRTWGA